MTTTEVYRRPETVPIWVYTEDWASAVADPSEGIKLTLYDSAEAVKVNNLALTRDAAGKYVYYYKLEATDADGLWRYDWTAVDGVGDEAKTQIGSGTFTVV